VPDAAARDAEQAERMPLFVLDDEEAAVAKLLDPRRFMDAGQWLKTR
jgi:hypothetical protein